MLILGFLEVFFLAAVAQGVDKISGKDSELFYFIKALNIGLGLNAIFIMIFSLISFVLLNSISEKIRLFIDIEQNTRIINSNLSKITKLLADKFEIQPEDIKEKESIIDKINYWGQIAPIVISVLFFLFILKQLPSGLAGNSNFRSNLESNNKQQNDGDTTLNSFDLEKKQGNREIIWEGDDNNGGHSYFRKINETDWIETHENESYYYSETSSSNNEYTLKDKNREGVSIFIIEDKCYYKDQNTNDWTLIYHGRWK
jgi:hypothetical protein